MSGTAEAYIVSLCGWYERARKEFFRQILDEFPHKPVAKKSMQGCVGVCQK